MIKIQIIYDNTSINRDLKPDWGFAALIQAFGKNILLYVRPIAQNILQKLKSNSLKNILKAALEQ